MQQKKAKMPKSYCTIRGYVMLRRKRAALQNLRPLPLARILKSSLRVFE